MEESERKRCTEDPVYSAEYYKINPTEFLTDYLKEYFGKVTKHQLALIENYKVKYEGLIKNYKVKYEGEFKDAKSKPK